MRASRDGYGVGATRGKSIRTIRGMERASEVWSIEEALFIETDDRRDEGRSGENRRDAAKLVGPHVRPLSEPIIILHCIQVLGSPHVHSNGLYGVHWDDQRVEPGS